MNISGILVQTKPENVGNVIDAINSSNCCEYHLHDEKGRIVVSIEGINTEEEIKKLTTTNIWLPEFYPVDEFIQEASGITKADNISIFFWTI